MAYGMGYGGMGHVGNGMQDSGIGWGHSATGRWNGDGSMNYSGDVSGRGYYSASSTSGGYSHQQFHENQFTAQQYHNHFQDGRSRQPFPPGINNRGSIGNIGNIGVGDDAGAVIGPNDGGEQFKEELQKQQDYQENACPSIMENSSDVSHVEGSVEPQTNVHPVSTVGTATNPIVTIAGTNTDAGREVNDHNNVLTTELHTNSVPPGATIGNGNAFHQQNYMNYPMSQYHTINPAMNPGMINHTLNNYGAFKGNFNGGTRGGRGSHWGGINGLSSTPEKPLGQGLGVEGAPTGPKALREREGFRSVRGGPRGGFRGGMRGGHTGSARSRRSAYHTGQSFLYTYIRYP